MRPDSDEDGNVLPDESGEDEGLADGGDDPDVADEDADLHGGEVEDEGEVDEEAGGLAGLGEVGEHGHQGHQEDLPVRDDAAQRLEGVHLLQGE